MTGRVAVTAILLAMSALPATAQNVDLAGVWQYSRVNVRGENYTGNINIDSAGQASDVTQVPSGGAVAQTGYVSVNGSKVEIVFTKAVPSRGGTYNADHFFCTVQSATAMSCSNTDVAGSQSYTFALLRVGKRR